MQGLFRDLEMPLNIVRAIHEHFRFDNRHQVRFLAECSVARQQFCICLHTLARRNVLPDADDRTPFGETRSQLPIFRQPLAQSVKTLRDFLAWEIGHRFGSFIHFNAGNDSLLLQRLDEGATVMSFLSNCLVEEDDPADKLAYTGGGK